MYKMTFDYHTHTIYSPGPARPHGKGTPEENVVAAIEKGLSGIAISDHGPGHLTYGLKRSKYKELRAEIERLKEKYPQIEIFMAVEANTIMSGNFLDVRPDEIDTFDFINAGYHFAAKNCYMIRNFANNARSGRENDELAQLNTRIIVGALESNNIKILTHPGDKAQVDMDRIAKACEKTGTWMEINNSHAHLSVEELMLCSKYDVKFVIGSDAHRPEKVGSCENALDRIIKAGIDIERVVNIEVI